MTAYTKSVVFQWVPLDLGIQCLECKNIYPSEILSKELTCNNTNN